MKHYQLKINMDKTFCADYYTNTLFSSDTIIELKNATEQAQSKLGIPFRKHPFSVVQCQQCGQWIISNRDMYEQFLCQHCKQETVMNMIESEEISSLLEQIHNTFGYTVESCNGMYCYMACVMPTNERTEQILQVLDRFGFEQAEHDGGQFTKIMLLLCLKNWYSSDKTLLYVVTKLTSRDCIFAGAIPRVEACDRVLRRVVAPIYTVSSHANEAPQRDRKQFIKMRVEELVAEGKMDEAMKLMDKL